VPGSHRWPDGPREGDPASEQAVAGVEPVIAAAGDAVVFDRRVWHRRSCNTSVVTRRAVFLAYAPRWIAQREEMDRSVVAGMGSALRRQMLGSREWDPSQPPFSDLPLQQWLANLALGRGVVGREGARSRPPDPR
jgi:ectoine hydroxylase-related dioxygenase (phytanoyl-CoA dioxygenase family)